MLQWLCCSIFGEDEVGDMSGGGGDGGGEDWRGRGSKGGGGTGGDGGASDKCEIYETVALNSPDEDVVSGLSAGGRLAVVLLKSPRRVVVQNSHGQTAGSITSPRLVDLIECIESGRTYDAIVDEMTGGRVTVNIQPS